MGARTCFVVVLALCALALGGCADEDNVAPSATSPPSTAGRTPTSTPVGAPGVPATPPLGPDTPVTSPPLPSPGQSAPLPSTPATAVPVPADRTEEPAPIEKVEVVVLESFPPQYVARITSGLPSGCARFSRTEIQRSDRTIRIGVYNTMPRDSNVACTMIYGMVETSVPLGSDFAPGATYTLEVNGHIETFVAQ